MAESKPGSILNRIRRMTAEVGGASDAQLLDRFAASRDEAAFELLLWRHERLVFGVCLRVLHDPHDAEDAFQATFFALARHAGRIAKREAVAGWLHKVAYRVALTARGQRARRDAREKLIDTTEHLAASPDAEAPSESQELRLILDQEIGRLPERFRAAVVLCYLEGKSVDEAARQLGCPRGTVASRLARARERLRIRLAGRGLAVTAALVTLTQANAAPRPLVLIPTLTAAALRYAAGGAAAEGALSPRITVLTEEVLRAMFLHRLKTGIVILIAFLGILLAGGLAAGLRAHPGPEPEPPKPGEEAAKDNRSSAFQTQAVRRGSLTLTVQATGTIEPEKVIDVATQAIGRLQEFGQDPDDPKKTVDYGTRVHKGTVLARIDPARYQLRRDQAQAHVNTAQAEIKIQEAQLQLAERAREKARKGIADRTGTAEDLDIASARCEIARARVAAARAAVEEAKTALREAAWDLDQTTICSPVEGVVIDRRAKVGQWVQSGANAPSLFLIATDLKRLEVWAQVNEADIGQVRVGQPVRFTVDAFPDTTFAGRVNQVRLNATMTQNVVTYTVVIAIDNPREKLLPYVTANVEIVRERKDALLVPNAALRWRPSPDQVAPDARGTDRARPARRDEVRAGTVWVEDESGQVRPHRLRLGASDGVVTEVVEGDLTEGQRVVTGQAALRSPKNEGRKVPTEGRPPKAEPPGPGQVPEVQAAGREE